MQLIPTTDRPASRNRASGGWHGYGGLSPAFGRARAPTENPVRHNVVPEAAKYALTRLGDLYRIDDEIGTILISRQGKVVIAKAKPSTS